MKKGKKDKVKSSKNQQVKNYEEFRLVQETTDMSELIELSKSEDPRVRVKAAQQMCPCRVQKDFEEFWERLFELAQDEDD